MSYPNAGVTANEWNIIHSIDPIYFRDLMDTKINSTEFSRVLVLKYRHDGYDEITGEFDQNKTKPCSCVQREYGSIGRSGINKVCSLCNGAGVRGGWKMEKLRGFYWNQRPPGLKSYSLLFTATMPAERMDAVFYVSAYEKKVKNGHFVILNYASELEEQQEEEFQIMNVRPVFIGEIVVWKWIVLQRHPIKISGK